MKTQIVQNVAQNKTQVVVFCSDRISSGWKLNHVCRVGRMSKGKKLGSVSVYRIPERMPKPVCVNNLALEQAQAFAAWLRHFLRVTGLLSASPHFLYDYMYEVAGFQMASYGFIM